MIGRQVLLTTRPFTLEELFDFMTDYWDTQAYNSFQLGSPTSLSVQKYILLPATQRYLTFIYPVSAGGLFRKENKIVLATADTPAGAAEGFLRAAPTSNVFFGAAKIGSVMSSEKERKDPAEEALLAYTAYMRELLRNAGYLKES